MNAVVPAKEPRTDLEWTELADRQTGPGEIRVKVAACCICHSGQEETETYQVRIPTCVQAGQSIRVSGKGGKRVGGGTAGNVHLLVRYAQQADWHARGPDPKGDLELAPWEAVLGATVPLRTLEGTVSAKVAAGT